LCNTVFGRPDLGLAWSDQKNPAQETYLTMRFVGHRSATIADRDVSGIIKCSLDRSLPATAHIQ
jgi:hypothetical protein